MTWDIILGIVFLAFFASPWVIVSWLGYRELIDGAVNRKDLEREILAAEDRYGRNQI